MEPCVIDLLAHYDAVAELMAAMGGWLENGAGSFNGLAVSYGRMFTAENGGKVWRCACLCMCGGGGKWTGRVSSLAALSCAEGEM